MDLVVQTRKKFGKAVRELRRGGLVPAVLYGRGIENLHLSVAVKDFAKTFKEAGMNSVVTLVVDKEKRPAIIHEVTRDAISGDVAHVDFYQVKMDEKIKAKVPLEFIGIAPAIKEKGAVLNKSMFEIEVEAFPQDLPHRLTVDVSSLDDLNKTIYVRDLTIPKTVKVLIGDGTAVVTATPPAPEEEKVEPVADVTEVKVESEEKVAERQAAKVEQAQPNQPAKQPTKPQK